MCSKIPKDHLLGLLKSGLQDHFLTVTKLVFCRRENGCENETRYKLDLLITENPHLGEAILTNIHLMFLGVLNTVFLYISNYLPHLKLRIPFKLSL